MTAAPVATSGADTDVELLCSRLRNTFRAGVTASYRWRIEQLRAIERFMDEERSAIAAALADDLGKTPTDVAMEEIGPTRIEARYSRRRLRRWMRRTTVSVSAICRPAKAWHACEPRGVVLIIGPWNYPLYLTLTPLVGALSAGNAVVIKPSEQAPALARVLAERLPRYLDPTAVAVVEGGADVTQQLLKAAPDFVFFTGGGAVGRAILETSATTLTPVALELGGKSPVVVCADADLDVAARRIAFGKVANAGQTCVAPDYVLVETAAYERFSALLCQNLTELTSDEPASGLRVVNQRRAKHLAGLIDSAGGTVILGGAVDIGGCRVPPTVVVDPAPDSALMQEEIFGPILPILRIDSVDHALQFIGNRPHPLAAYLFSTDSEVQGRFARDVHAGGVGINQVMMHVGAPQLPFGGVGPSGMGTYHGRWGFETFSHRKAVLAKPYHPDIRLIYPPYGRTRQWLFQRFL
jgi:aldehyde dehydrogenase (NAD+)